MIRIPVSTAVFLCVAVATLATPSAGQDRRGAFAGDIERLAAEVSPKVVEWRRDIHQHPELGNREFRTSAKVADHLRALGMEVRTGIAHTGVVGILRGGRPGPTVALRADMDALPVTEMVDLPFASKVRTEYNGQEVGVMHACGHDTHTAMLMGTAEVLASLRDRLPGTVLFLFQPAEEGAPEGEEGGAGLMIREGAFADPKPDVIFGLHVWPVPTGTLRYRPEGAMAASDGLEITVVGQQTHAALPWGGVDPVVVASQIVLGLQAIVSRQSDLTKGPAVITIGVINGGVRSNIIPDSVVMVGTIRTFDEGMRTDIHDRIRRTAEGIAAAAGAEARVRIPSGGLPVTFNDPELTLWAVPALERAAGPGAVTQGPPITGAEDFSLYQKEIPGLFFFLGITPEGRTPYPNHSPLFYVDETAFPVGMRAMAGLAADYLLDHQPPMGEER